MRRLVLVLALAFVAGCAHRAKSSPDIVVAPVVARPVKIENAPPKCGPEHENGALDASEAMNEVVRAICVRGDEDTAADFMAHLPVRIGATLDATMVQRSVEILFASGYYRRVDVYARRVDKGVEVTFDMETLPIIRAVDLPEGKSLPSAEVGHRYAPELIFRELRTRYPNDLAKVEARPDGNGGVHVTITIDEGALP